MNSWLHRRHEIEEFDRVICRLKASDARTQLSVGTGVQLANSEFITRFGTLEIFRRSAPEEQQHFLSWLDDKELDARGDEPGGALGISLYRIWLANTLRGRHDMAEKLGETLTLLSRKVS